MSCPHVYCEFVNHSSGRLAHPNGVRSNEMTVNLSNKPTHQVPHQAPKALEFANLLYALWMDRWFMASVTALATLIGGYYAFAAVTPLYRSSAVVILEPRVDQIAVYQSLSGSLTGDAPEMNSEIEILRSRSLMHLVAKQLNLASDPEFNRSLTPPTKKVVLKSQLKKMLGWSSLPDNLSSDDFDQRAQDTVVTALLKKVHVENLRQSTVFRVTVSSRSAAKAASIADTIVALYIQKQIDQKIQASQQATTWLKARVGQLQLELEISENKLSSFSASSTLISEESLQASNRQLKNVRERIATAEKLKNISTEVPQIDQQLVSLRASEADLSRQLNRFGQDLIAQNQLEREAQAVRALYEHFLSRLKEASAQQGIQKADSRILSPAVIPYVPFAPRKPLIVSMATIFGLSISMLLVLFGELRRTTFRIPSKLENYANHYVLGKIPALPPHSRKDLVGHIAQFPEGTIGTSICALRTTLLFNELRAPPKVIGLTSFETNGSQTPAAMALAQDLASTGLKVVFVDTDPTSKKLDRYFDDGPKLGITSFLEGALNASECIHQSKELGADIAYFNDPSLAAQNLLMNKNFDVFINEMKSRYDVVIINCAALVSAPSARTVLRSTDTIVAAVKWDVTTTENIDAGQRIANSAGLKITGLVLTDVSPKFG